ncbi:MAG: hypothetical protein LUG18_03210 [Candidatus Azobacteroides sp.]|nr:hypothetical protein [Candidatus Azobacteroides sp.]
MRKCMFLIFHLFPVLCVTGWTGNNSLLQESSSGNALWLKEKHVFKTDDISPSKKASLFIYADNQQEISKEEDSSLKVAPPGEPGDGSAQKTPLHEHGFLLPLLFSFLWVGIRFRQLAKKERRSL